MLEGHQGHLESDALALQVVPDRHGWQYVREFPVAKGNRSTGGELTRKEW
jgi:hypothetical protein